MVRNLGELGINLQKIVTRLLANQDLLKLLYYSDKDPLSNPDLSDTEIQKNVFEKLVKVVPRVGPKETAQSLISLRVVRASADRENNEFNSMTLCIEVFTPLTQWFIKDTSLRPFCIMGEILESLNHKVINGLGRLEHVGFDLNFITEEISCYEMTFQMIDYD